MTKNNNATDGAGALQALADELDQTAESAPVETTGTETATEVEAEEVEPETADEVVETDPEEVPEVEVEEPETEKEPEKEVETDGPAVDEKDLEKWKHFSRDNEKKLKEANAKLAKADATIAKSKKDVEALKLETLKYQMVLEKGLNVDDLILLDGNSKEQIEAKATHLAKRAASGKSTNSFSFNPLQGLGAGHEEAPLDDSPDSLFRSVLDHAKTQLKSN